MPLPLILGAAALVTAAYGAKKGYDGYQRHSEADEIVKGAQERYEAKKEIFDEQETKTTSASKPWGKRNWRSARVLLNSRYWPTNCWTR